MADLTHTYIALASGTFPLGMAYVATSIRKQFGDSVEVRIFKYPTDLQDAITECSPDVFMFSNYVWNQNLGLAFAEKIKKINPQILVISGGPNFSQENTKQYEFLKNNAFVDFHVLGEGEVAAVELLCLYMNVEYSVNSLKNFGVRQSIYLYNDKLCKGNPINRIGAKKNECVSYNCDQQTSNICSLDDIGSPYLNGMLDEFFDNKLYPLIETNRGCPFSCTYCQQGEIYFNKISMRSTEMTIAEIDYIAEKMAVNSPGVARIEFADANFAMFKQDIKVTSHLRTIQDKYGWPRIIGCSTGKNKPGQVIESVEKVFPNTLVIANSMQSTNASTLK